jgi:hypothetical protein
VVVYRAPSFSIVEQTIWAFEILAEAGFLIDSSVFPVKHDLYGIPDAERFPHWRTTSEGQPAMVYLHPWEIDPDQPRIKAGLRSRLRHYTNLSRMENKLERLLQDFRFSTLSDVCSRLEVYRSGLEMPSA